MVTRKEFAELKTQISELSQSLSDLSKKVERLNTLADSAIIKATMSHSLIVVRKISEENLDKLNQVLD